VLIAFGAWAYGLAQGRSDRAGMAFRSLAALAGLGAVLIAASVTTDRAGEVAASTPEAGYEAFTQQKLDALLAAERPVFVNMTAAWCITCLVNERTALSARSVREAFAGKGIAYLKGDWTNRNPEITRLLERFGRSGVPLYVLYRNGREPVVLPQILTQSLVLETIQR
jgi:thiol:disulfide interchange protein DsbD